MLLGKQIIQRDLVEIRIGQIFIAIDKRFLGRFDENVIVIGRTFAQFLDIDIVQDIENFKRCHALSVRRQVVGGKAAIIDGQRFDPICFMIGKIL